MSRRTAASVCISLCIGFGVPSVALSGEKPPLTSPLTFDEAIAIALKAQPGEVAEVSLDRADGDVVIEIEIVNADGDEVEFHLDAESGEILETWVDGDPSDDPD